MPVQLSATEFPEGIVPHLSRPKRGPTCTLGSDRVFNLIFWVLDTGRHWTCLPVPTEREGHPASPSTTGDTVFAKWSDAESLEPAFIARVGHLSAQQKRALRVLRGDGTNTVATKGGDGLGDSGDQHQTGAPVLAIRDTQGSVVAPRPVAPVNEAETGLLPEGLHALTRVAPLTGWGRTGS